MFRSLRTSYWAFKLNSKNIFQQVKAIREITSSGPRGVSRISKALLSRALRNSDHDVRTTAAVALSRNKDVTGLPILINELERTCIDRIYDPVDDPIVIKETLLRHYASAVVELLDSDTHIPPAFLLRLADLRDWDYSYEYADGRGPFTSNVNFQQLRDRVASRTSRRWTNQLPTDDNAIGMTFLATWRDVEARWGNDSFIAERMVSALNAKGIPAERLKEVFGIDLFEMERAYRPIRIKW